MLPVAFVIANDAAPQLCEQEKDCKDPIQALENQQPRLDDFHPTRAWHLLKIDPTPSDVLVSRRHLKQGQR